MGVSGRIDALHTGCTQILVDLAAIRTKQDVGNVVGTDGRISGVLPAFSGQVECGGRFQSMSATYQLARYPRNVAHNVATHCCDCRDWPLSGTKLRYTRLPAVRAVCRVCPAGTFADLRIVNTFSVG
jgi:hypothetical protein